MVRIPLEIKKTIDRYLEALNKSNIPIKEAILFGGYAMAIIVNGVTSTLHSFLRFLKVIELMIRIKYGMSHSLLAVK